MSGKYKPRGQGPEEGTLFAIPLGNEEFAFGVVAKGGDCAFFDYKTSRPLPEAHEVITKPVAFRVPTYRSIITDGVWKSIGTVTLSGSLGEEAYYRNQPIGSNQNYKVKTRLLIESKLPISNEEAQTMEVMAWWDVPFIVQRLKDHFAGVPNSQAEHFKTIRRYDTLTGQDITMVRSTED